MIEPEILQAIAAGGDVGIWVIAAGMWRLDRRLVEVEFWVKVLKRGQNADIDKAG